MGRFLNLSFLESFVLLVVVVYPVSIVLVPYLGTVLFVLLSFLSAYLFFSGYRKLNYTKEEKVFFLSCLLLIGVSILVSLIKGMDAGVWKTAGRFSFILMSIPLYFVFKTYLIKTRYIWWAIVVAVVLCGIAAIYEYNFGAIYNSHSMHSDRAKAGVHPIHFADIVLSMTMMVVAASTSLKKVNIKVVLAVILIFILGISAVILSMSRGAWAMIPVFAVFMAWVIKSKVPQRYFYSGIAAFLMLSVLFYLVPSTGIKSRVDQTIHNVVKYSPAEKSQSSIGSRFEMWKAGWILFKENPVVGVGWGNYKQEAQLLVDKGIVSPVAARYTHPHSQYVSALASGGIIMFVILFFVFILPFKLFLDLYKSKVEEANPYALSGMVLILGFMVFALSATVFERSIPVSFYAFYLPLLYAVGNRLKSQQQ